VGAGVNAIRTRTLLEHADVVVVRFGEQYRHDHALKEVDRAALAVAREPEQVVEILRYVVEGTRVAS
jgi:hypothetical protein